MYGLISDASIRSDIVEAPSSERNENLIIDETQSNTVQQEIESPSEQTITDTLIQMAEIPLEPIIQHEPVINEPEPVINHPEPVINPPEPETPIRPSTQQNVQTPAIQSRTPVPSSSSSSSSSASPISDSQPRTSKRDRRVSPRGQLEKRPRKESQIVNFAPRQKPKEKFWILDYEYETYTKQLRKKKGFDEFRTAHFQVVQPPEPELRRQTNEYRERKLREHNNRQPTQREKNNAKADGYVLDDDWKTQFTIKAFGGVRHVNQKLMAVATQFRRDDSVLELQWEKVSNVKKFAETALRDYCAFVNREENLNLRI